MLYTIKEVSEILKTNVTYVHRLRKAGLLPCIKLGAYKVRKEALERFLEKYEGYDLTEPEEVKEGDVYETISTPD
jgi:excisionase family DNA binding protein